MSASSSQPSLVPDSPDLSQFLTTNQAARLLERSPELIRRLAVRGVLPSVTSPHGRLFARADVEALREARVGAV